MPDVSNSEALVFRVIGIPVPAPRAGRNGKRSYTPPQVEHWKRQIRFACSQAVEAAGWRQVTDSPLRMIAAFWLPRPKKASGIFAATKGRNDVDNLVKAVMDAMTDANESPWGDDGLVVHLETVKAWESEYQTSGVQVQLMELPA